MTARETAPSDPTTQPTALWLLGSSDAMLCVDDSCLLPGPDLPEGVALPRGE